MRSIRIVEPGPLATVQDRGRYGYRSWGVPLSGAMDLQALRVGNLLVGNSEDAAAIEITLAGFRAEFLCDAHFALTGALGGGRLNGVPIKSWQAHRAGKGDIVSVDNPPPYPAAERGARGYGRAIGERPEDFDPPPLLREDFFPGGAGIRIYLAVSGGIETPPVMGSRSTYLRGGFGGHEGRALRAKDELALGASPGSSKTFPAPAELVPNYSHAPTLRVIPGPQDDRVSEEGKTLFFSRVYEITNRVDRMGLSLSGPVLDLPSGADIISDGTCPGAVQVHGNGQPTILGADSQTTGGYVKIACVISADLPLVGQLMPGDRVRFSKIDLWEARGIYLQNEYRIKTLLR